MRVIAVANQKGGCGKTTTSINLAACLAFLQKKVVLIDMDPQGHSTCGLGSMTRDFPWTLYDWLKPEDSRSSKRYETLYEIQPNFFLVPSDETLARLEEDLTSVPNSEKRLRQRFEELRETRKDLQYVILDCPPNLGVLTYNALYAADDLIIPMEPS